jgi:hypothetical protein
MVVGPGNRTAIIHPDHAKRQLFNDFTAVEAFKRGVWNRGNSGIGTHLSCPFLIDSLMGAEQ